jgi:Tfp pilus assembly protein PilO
VTLTDRDRNIVLALIPILLVAAYWFLLLSPKKDEASKAAKELAHQEKRVSDARAQVTAASSAKTSFATDYSEIVKLGKAIPATLDMPSLIVQLDRAAAGTGIHFTRIARGESDTTTTPSPTPPATGSTSSSNSRPVEAGGQTAQSAPGAAVESANNAQQTAEQRNQAAEQSGLDAGDTETSSAAKNGGLPVGGGSRVPGAASASGAAPAGLQTVPLELEFVGDFFNLADFFHDVKRFVRVVNQDVVVSGRLVTIEDVSFSSDPELFPKLKAELSATVYLSPKTEGATAGATPQGPTPAAPPSGGSTTTASDSPAATTAPTAAATP